MNDNYIHESGHAVFAAIFETLTIEFLTLNESLSQQYDIKSLGGLKAKLSILRSELTAEDHDKIILIMLAGLCAEEKNKSGQIAPEFFAPKNYSDKFCEPRFSGDSELITIHFEIIENKININADSYFTSSLHLVNNILNEEIIWDIVIKLKQKLIDAPNHTLTGIQISEIINETSLSTWKDENLGRIYSERKSIFI